MKRAWMALSLSVVGLLVLSSLGVEASSSDEEQAELKIGSKVYKKICVACHTPKGKSPIEELNLADDKWSHVSSLEDIEQIISKGIPDTAMVALEDKLSPEEIRAVAKYIRTFSASAPK